MKEAMMMEIRISDLMDYLQDDTVPFEVKDIASADKIKEATMNKLHTNTTTHRRPRKIATILIAAALAVSLLTGVAFATGIAQSIFSAMIGRNVGDDPGKYETIDALSNKDEVTVSVPELDSASVTLKQSYYDGEQLMLGFTLDNGSEGADFDFGPGHEMFDKLQPVKDEYNQVLALDFENLLTADEYTKMMQLREENGSVGIIFEELFVGDHVLLDDGQDIGPHGQAKTPDGVYMEFATPLAEAAQNLDELNIMFKMKCIRWYFYIDSSDADNGFYYSEYITGGEGDDWQQVELTIPRSVG
jgi:hypothetical protein